MAIDYDEEVLLIRTDCQVCGGYDSFFMGECGNIHCPLNDNDD